MPATHIILTENNHVFRHNLRQICVNARGVEVIGETSAGEEVVCLAETLKQVF
jgi:DNA-binding NarL/FixJ family response regulator